MKLADVDFVGQSIAKDCYLIETFDDIFKYVELALELTMRDLRLSNRIPMSRWDHIWTQGSFWSIALRMAEMRNTSIACEIAEHSSVLTRNLGKYIDRGEKVVIQQAGGYAPICETIKVVREKPYTGICETHRIEPDTEYLVLENDPVIDEAAKEWLADKPYSIIVNLRSYPNDQLSKIFKSFHGNTIFVATTGMDDRQMSSYLTIAEECGIKNAIIKWTCIPSNEALEATQVSNLNITPIAA